MQLVLSFDEVTTLSKVMGATKDKEVIETYNKIFTGKVPSIAVDKIKGGIILGASQELTIPIMTVFVNNSALLSRLRDIDNMGYTELLGMRAPIKRLCSQLKEVLE